MLRKFFQTVPKQSHREAVADKKLSVLAWYAVLLPIPSQLVWSLQCRNLLACAGAETQKDSAVLRTSRFCLSLPSYRVLKQPVCNQ